MTDPALTNADLAPTTAAQRTWRWYHFVALWIGMVMCIPAYTLASSMIGVGMSWGEAVFTVFLGNLIVLIPMLLIGHAGARFGIPYAVLARASFGTTGARLPAMMRALVACGWYGIQTQLRHFALHAREKVAEFREFLNGHTKCGAKHVRLAGID